MFIKNNRLLTVILAIIIFITFVINLKVLHELLEKQRYINAQEKYKKQLQNEENNYYSKTKLQKVENRQSYYAVKTCIEKYYSTLNYLWIDNSKQVVFGEEEPVTTSGYTVSEEYVERLLKILPKDYKEKFNINSTTIPNKFKFLQSGKPVIDDIYEYNMNTGLTAYIVLGNYITRTKEVNDFKLMVLMDRTKNVFEIYPEEFLIENQLDEFSGKEDLDFLYNTKEIKVNDCNTIKMPIVTDEKVSEDYFYLFKYLMRYSPEIAYKRLDEEYRTKKFGDFNTFKKYIEENMKYFGSSITEYNSTNSNNYKQFVCLDENKYYYIFRESSCLDYNVILDTYTLDLPEFIAKYDKANEKERAALNIKKFIDAVNEHDYKYAYNCLDSNFKENKFNTFDNFEQYVKTNFFEKNEFEFIDFNNEGYLYIFSIKVTESKKQSSDEAILQVIMEVSDDRSFVMSFNMQ